MASTNVEIKGLKREMFKLRGRWLKFQRDTAGEDLRIAAQPIVEAARQNAPVLQGVKRGRVPGALRSSIGTVVRATVTGRVRVLIGPVGNKKSDLFYARFQELGWQHTGRAPRRKAKRRTPIGGRHFLRNAALAHTTKAFNIWRGRAIQRMREDYAVRAV